MNEEKSRRQNLIIMGILIVCFTIGIIFRWEYIRTELFETWRGMFSQQ